MCIPFGVRIYEAGRLTEPCCLAPREGWGGEKEDVFSCAGLRAAKPLEISRVPPATRSTQEINREIIGPCLPSIFFST